MKSINTSYWFGWFGLFCPYAPQYFVKTKYYFLGVGVFNFVLAIEVPYGGSKSAHKLRIHHSAKVVLYSWRTKMQQAWFQHGSNN